MKVLKFGGTSVGSAARMQGVVNLINDGETKEQDTAAQESAAQETIE